MRYLLLFVCCVSTIGLFAQRQELLNKIADDACACMEEKDLSGDFEMVMGMCILQASSPLTEAIKKELDIDLNSMDNYEQLGEVVAVSLVARCPSFMNAMMEYLDDEGMLEEDKEATIEDESDNPSWSDMDAAAAAGAPEYGGPENKSFITAPLPDTNGSGLSRPRASGTIKTINPGLVSEIRVKTVNGTMSFYLDRAVPGVGRIQAKAKVSLTYRSEKRYNAQTGKEEFVKIITGVE